MTVKASAASALSAKDPPTTWLIVEDGVPLVRLPALTTATRARAFALLVLLLVDFSKDFFNKSSMLPINLICSESL